MHRLRRLVRCQGGQDLIEYALLGAAVALGVYVGASTLGLSLNGWYTELAGVTGVSAEAVTASAMGDDDGGSDEDGGSGGGQGRGRGRGNGPGASNCSDQGAASSRGTCR